MSEQNKQVVRRLLEDGMGRGDIGVVEQLVSDDFVSGAGEMQTRGVEGYKQFVQALHQAFPDLELSVEDQVAEGDKVVSRWRARGTHRGEYFGIPPSGARGEITGINIDRVVEGKTVECYGEQDSLGLLRQIGALPSAAR